LGAQKLTNLIFYGNLMSVISGSGDTWNSSGRGDLGQEALVLCKEQ